MVSGTKTVFVVVGLAGTSGTAAAVLISRLAKETGARAAAIGILPFVEEGPEADFNARHGLAKLQSACDVVVVAKNEQLRGMHPKMDIGKALQLMDAALLDEVKRLTAATGHSMGGTDDNVVLLDIGVTAATGNLSTHL